jgi:hypothetical protein
MPITRRAALVLGATALTLAALKPGDRHARSARASTYEFDPGDGVTPGSVEDSSASLRSFLEGLPDGAHVAFPPGARIRVGSLVTLTKPVHIDGRGAEIFTSGINGIFAIPAAASGSSFRDLRVRGSSPSTYAAVNKAFNILGSPRAWVTGLRFEKVECDGFGYGGFYGSHVSDASFRDCAVRNSVYCGFLFLSPRDVDLFDPVVDTLRGIPVNGFMQSYGIAWTRDSREPSIQDYPTAENCTTWGGLIRNTGWEGVDTHGGINIRTIGTEILGCMHGVAYVPCPDVNGDDRWAPQNCLVAFCTIDSLRSDSSKATGVKLVGAGDRGRRRMAATGAILGNTITGHGRGETVAGDTADRANVGGGIQLYQTDAVRVEGNRIVEPNPFGISLWYDNTRCDIGINTVQDPWSETFPVAAAIAVRSTGNSVSIGATKLVAGSKVAPYVNSAGLYVSDDAANVVTIAEGADFGAAMVRSTRL